MAMQSIQRIASASHNRTAVVFPRSFPLALQFENWSKSIATFSTVTKAVLGNFMNILMSSYVFSPSVGGIETVSSILAHEFVRRGASVKLVTQTPSPQRETAPFEII